MRRYLLALAAILQIAAATAANASALTVDGGINGVSYESGCTFSLTSANPLSGSCSGPFSNSYNYYVGLNSNFEATASYNKLGAYAFQDIEITSYIPSTNPIGAPAEATAFLSDKIELPSSYLEPVFVTFGWTANGSGYGALELSWGATCTANIVSSQSTCVETQEIFPGISYNLQVVLEAEADISFSGFPGDGFSQTSDFSHTAILSQVGTFDQNMNPLSGVQLISDSGFDYQDNVLSDAPEPNGLWLTLAGLAVTGLLKCLSARKQWVGWRSGPPSRPGKASSMPAMPADMSVWRV